MKLFAIGLTARVEAKDEEEARAIALLPKKSLGFARVDRCFLVSLTKGRQNSKEANDCLPHGEWCYKSWKQ
jgi:hypothetical protein